MLRKGRRRAPHRTGRACEFDCHPGHADAILLDTHGAVGCVRVGHRLIDCLHRAGWHTGCHQQRAQGRGIKLRQRCFNLSTHRCAVGHARAAIGKARITDPFITADGGAKFAELAVVDHTQKQFAIARGVFVVGRNIRMAAAGAQRHLARRRPIGRMRNQQAERGVVKADVEQLPAARMVAFGQCRHHAEGAVQSGDNIDQRDADARRTARRLAIDAHQPAHGLQHGVVTGQVAERAISAKAGDAAVDQTGKARCQHGVVTQAPLLHRAGQKIFDQHVGIFEQAQQHLARSRHIEIERQRLLVAVEAQKVGGGVAYKRRAEHTRLIPLRRLDLEHGCALVAQHLCAVGASQHARQIDYAQTGQRAASQGEGRRRCGGSGHGTQSGNTPPDAPAKKP